MAANAEPIVTTALAAPEPELALTVAKGATAAPELVALLEDQQVALQERLEQLRRHAAYVKHKIAYWRAIEVHDDHAADIARTLAGQILTDAQCAPGQAIR